MLNKSDVVFILVIGLAIGFVSAAITSVVQDIYFETAQTPWYEEIFE